MSLGTESLPATDNTPSDELLTNADCADCDQTTRIGMPKARQRPLSLGGLTTSATSSCPWRNVLVLLLLPCLLTLHLCDACAQGQFMNVSAGTCQQCTDCGQLRLRPVRPCNGTDDSLCERCTDPNEYYNKALQRCTLDCTLCPHGGRCAEGMEDQCDCSFARCVEGRMCDQRSRDPRCVVTTPPTTSTTGPAITPQDDSPVFLPHWGIALVSVGVIVGIILFSALFVLLGLATSHRKSRHEDFSSSNTTSSSVADKLSYSTGRHSTSLVSLYTQSNSPAFQNYLLSLNALKTTSHGNLGSSWNNLKNSPKTERSSSVPVTIVNKSRDGFWTPV